MGALQISPALLASAFVIVLTAGLGASSWTHRKQPGALPFTFVCILGVLWAGGSAAEAIATEPGAYEFWVQFQAICLTFVPLTTTWFILHFAQLSQWLTRRNFTLMAAPAAVAAVLMATNSWHHLAWASTSADDGSFIRQFGPVLWLTLAYSLALAMLKVTVLIRRFVLSPPDRRPTALMLIGDVAGHVGFAIGAITQYSFIGIPFDLLAVTVPFVLYAAALFGFHVFDPVPDARRAALAQMSEGMLVLDTTGSVVDANPAVGLILGRTVQAAHKQSAAELLPRDVLGSGWDGRPTPGTREIALVVPEGRRYVEVSSSRLSDRRGKDLGDLVLLQDVTAERIALERQLEHERVEATLLERERLANELHDGVGQVLGFVSMQTQAIRRWVREGEADRADSLLTRLSDVAQHAQTDVRESILELKAGNWKDWSFLASLERYLNDFRSVSNLETQLIAQPWDDHTFEPAIGIQVLRVVQEAVNNARRHADPGFLRVEVEPGDRYVRVTVTDDGRGFDPTDPGSHSGPHFGLSTMAERMASIGGSLLIDSRIGHGTRVVIDAPLNHGTEAR